jgi:DNA-binding PadR family transcriptional regulator
MTKENVTEYIIMGLLTHEDLSGYDIKKRIDISISNFWEIGYGQIYPTLKTLQREGNITGTSAQSAIGPERIVYTITDAGAKKLSTWLNLPEHKENVKYEILLKIFFGNLLPREDTVNRIEAFKKSHLAISQQMTAYKKSLEGVLSQDDDHLYFYLTVLFGEHVYQAYLDWADEAMALLKEYPVRDQKEH